MIAIDRLRGLLALFVVIHHAAMNVAGQVEIPRSLEFLRFGGYAVAGFLAVSGYSLAIGLFPVDRWKGTRHYFARRVRRIAPAYYLVLALSLLVALTILRTKIESHWGPGDEITVSSVIAHVLMIHNLSSEWRFKINYPMWSIATELQVYLLIPLFVAIRRIWGQGAAFAVCFFIPLLAFGRGSWNELARGASFGFLHFGVFFMIGVVARYAEFRITFKPKVLNSLAWIFLGGAVALGYWDFVHSQLAANLLIAAAVGVHLIASPTGEAERRFDPLAFVGAFSYTLYLSHAIFVELTWRFLILPNIDGVLSRLASIIFLGTAVSLLFAYGLYLLAEKPFSLPPAQASSSA